MQQHNCPYCGRDVSATLTERECQVLGLIARGYTNRAIALALGISRYTVRSHVSAIMVKLCAASRAQAVAVASQRGILVMCTTPK